MWKWISDMFIFDRYVLRIFFKVLLVSSTCLCGLFIVIDAFGNLDEFLVFSEKHGNLFSVLSGYYGVRVLSFFDRTSGLLTLVAAMFTITWLQRTNEFTALLAAGVSKARIALPLIGAVAVVGLLAAANRELLIPTFRDQLSRNAQDLAGQAKKSVNPQWDHKTDILLGGRYWLAGEQRIVDPNFRLDAPMGDFGRDLIATSATYRPPQSGRPGGYLLHGVKRPANLAELDTAKLDGKPIIFSPRDTSWLKPDQCFVASDITFQQLTAGDAWQQYSSSRELITALHNPSLDLGVNVPLTVHTRLVQPFLDVTLLFLGLPLVLTRHNRNIFVAAGWCLLVVAGFFLVVLACQALGTNYLISPALSAWIPLMIFIPLAFTLAEPLRE